MGKAFCSNSAAAAVPVEMMLPLKMWFPLPLCQSKAALQWNDVGSLLANGCVEE